MNKDNLLTGQQEGAWSQNYIDFWKKQKFSISEPASELTEGNINLKINEKRSVPRLIFFKKGLPR